MQTLIKDLNHLYRETEALYQLDCEGAGFDWLVADAEEQSVYAFLRKDANGGAVVVVSNFTPVPSDDFRVGVPEAGHYVERLNTDSETYGGSNIGNQGGVDAEAVPSHGREYSVSLRVPPLATLVLELEKSNA